MKLPKKLEAMRDKLADAACPKRTSLTEWRLSPSYYGRTEGFNAASDIYLPVVIELLEACEMSNRLDDSWNAEVLASAKESLGLKFAIQEIEGTEALMIKAHSELPYSNPKEAEREHGNLMRVLAVMKSRLQSRYEWKP